MFIIPHNKNHNYEATIIVIADHRISAGIRRNDHIEAPASPADTDAERSRKFMLRMRKPRMKIWGFVL
jgi:hypothetical protein